MSILFSTERCIVLLTINVKAFNELPYHTNQFKVSEVEALLVRSEFFQSNSSYFNNDHHFLRFFLLFGYVSFAYWRFCILFCNCILYSLKMAMEHHLTFSLASVTCSSIFDCTYVYFWEVIGVSDNVIYDCCFL